MADPAVQAADEEHRRGDACTREGGRVVPGSRGELDEREAARGDGSAQGGLDRLAHRDRLGAALG